MRQSAEDFDYESIPSGYYDHVIKSGSAVRRMWHEEKFRRVASLMLKNGASVLDLGCASGTFLSRLSEEQYPLQIGVDISKIQIEYANQHYGTVKRRFIHIEGLDDIEKIKEMFDYITVMELLEHLNSEQIGHLLELASRKLKPGGTLIITTPNYISPWPLVEFIVNRLSDLSYESQHISKFSYFTIIKSLKKLYPEFSKLFSVQTVATSHFISPFFAAFSSTVARKIGSFAWSWLPRFPFGNMLIVSLRRV